MKSLRFRYLFTILIAPLTLLALNGAGYAIGRLWGYPPGVGVVQGTPLPTIHDTYQPSPVTIVWNEREETNPNPLSISKVIDNGDSYILTGRFTSINPQYSFDHSLKIIDADGAEVLWGIPKDIEPEFSDGSEFWAAQFDKVQAYPIHIEYSELLVTLDPSKTETYEFEFDTGTGSQIGQVWHLNRKIKLANYVFALSSISIRQGGGCAECLSQFEYVFSFTVPEPVTPTTLDPSIYFSQLNQDSAIAPSLNFLTPDGRINTISVNFVGYASRGGGMSAGGTDLQIGNQQPNLLRGKINVRIANLPGSSKTKKWELGWQPDGYTASTDSTPVPQPCLTSKSWKTALSNPDSIPTNLNGKVVTSLINEDLSSFHISISNLDGSGQININNTQYASLSPDGNQVVFTRISEGLLLLNLATGEEHLLPNTEQDDTRPYWVKPFWSPDGTMLSFIRDGFYIVNADGTGLRKIFGDNRFFDSFGWSSDSRKLYVSMSNPNGFPIIAEVDLATNATRNLLSEQSKQLITWMSLSPDESRIAFTKSYDGSGTQIIYISNLDGSDPMPIARSENGWIFSSPSIWSPDGHWLTIGIVDMQNDPYALHSANALVNPQNCQIIPLPLEGSVQSWVP